MTIHPTADRDVMACRSCGRQERASEGYPCDTCGTFLCVVCSLRGVTRCAACEGRPLGPPPKPAPPPAGGAPAVS
jgi:hypothetical protein